MVLTDLDEHDIRQAFEVLLREEEEVHDSHLTADETASISWSNIQLIYLGLGFSPQRMTVEDLKQAFPKCCSSSTAHPGSLQPSQQLNTQSAIDPTNQHIPDRLSLNHVLALLSNFHRDRDQDLQAGFDLVISSSRGGQVDEVIRNSGNNIASCITANDLMILGHDVGQIISESEAKRMISYYASGYQSVLSSRSRWSRQSIPPQQHAVDITRERFVQILSVTAEGFDR